MDISRRLFLKYCGASSIVLASCNLPGQDGEEVWLDDLDRLEAALPTGLGARVIWLAGSGCSGCSVSFLNRFANAAPITAADVLMNVVVLGYHPTIMAAAGDQAVAAAESFYAAGGGTYILVVEGGVPTAFNGAACIAYRDASGAAVTFLSAVRKFATNASAVLSIGTCASAGGVSGASPNLTSVRTVANATGLRTINIPGCPPHPDWITAGLVAVLSGGTLVLDGWRRPQSIYGDSYIHLNCLRNQGAATVEATTFGVDGLCLRKLGCRGPVTVAPCPSSGWNSGLNWCVDANGPCIGCTESTFPRVGLRQPV